MPKYEYQILPENNFRCRHILRGAKHGITLDGHRVLALTLSETQKALLNMGNGTFSKVEPISKEDAKLLTIYHHQPPATQEEDGITPTENNKIVGIGLINPTNTCLMLLNELAEKQDNHNQSITK